MCNNQSINIEQKRSMKAEQGNNWNERQSFPNKKLVDPVQQEQQFEQFQVDRKDLSCPICKQIFDEPVTLNCGHTFCKICIYRSIMKSQVLKNQLNESSESKNQDQKLLREQSFIQKQEQCSKQEQPMLPICYTCRAIIWKPLSTYAQNLVLTNLINKYGFLQVKPSRKHSEFLQSDVNVLNSYHILLKCKKPESIPLPSCFSRITFYTHCPNAVIERSSESCVVLKYFEKNQKIGLKNGKFIDFSQNFDGIAAKCLSIQRINQSKGIYVGKFLGLHFVKIKQQIKIQNQATKSMGDSFFMQEQPQINLGLTLCTSQIVHAKNQQNIQNFQFFFQFYDMLNNPHYIRQINHSIDKDVFQFRNNFENMVYCAIRVLRLPEQLELQIISVFDDEKRIEMINDWLIGKTQSLVQEVMRVSKPGNFGSGIVIIIFFVVLGLNFLR